MACLDTPVFDWPGPLGTWLHLADAHWLTDASLRAAAKLHPAGDWDVRRFRPTALIAVDGDDFAEDGWTNVQAGPVGTDVLMPTPRCSMPARPQPALDADTAIGTTLRAEHPRPDVPRAGQACAHKSNSRWSPHHQKKTTQHPTTN